MSEVYLISPPQIELPKFVEQLKSAISGGPIAMFQLRLKPEARHPALVAGPISNGTSLRASLTGSRNKSAMTNTDEILNAAEILIPICRANNIRFIINDSAEIAMKCNADGVHIGSDDGDVAAAKKTIGNKILGVSCYNSLDAATAAASAGADYISFGAFYPTQTKVPKARAVIKTIKEFQNWQLAIGNPQSKIATIGGITPQNAKPLIAAGANYICAISYIWNHPISPAKAVAEFTLPYHR